MATEVKTQTAVAERSTAQSRGWIITLVFGALVFLDGVMAPFVWADLTESSIYLLLALGAVVIGISWDGYRGKSVGRRTWMALWVSVLAALVIAAIEFSLGLASVGGWWVVLALVGATGLWLARPRGERAIDETDV